MTKPLSSISILGSGWLGLPLAKHLLHSHTIKLATRSEQRLKTLPNIFKNTFSIDIEQLENNTLMQFLDSDSLIINITNKNIVSFQKLINEIEQSPIQNVLFISSTSVYQNTNSVVSEQDNAEDPNNLLFEIENRFINGSHFKTTILRLSGLIGPKRHPGLFFRYGKAVQQADAPVNLIHLDDCIGIISNIIQQNCWGETFHASADTHPTKREFYTYARALLNLELPAFNETEQLSYKIISNQKVKQQLSYKFIHPDLMQIDF